MSGEGDHLTLPWKNPSWDFAKPMYSGNVGDQLGKKIACSSSHGQTVAEKGPDPLPVPTRKRSHDMIVGENKDGKGEPAVNGGKTVGESDHEMHIWTERERRKKMRNMFANLHALLPHIPPKADKSTVVDEAVNYIKNLENTLQDLQKQKQEKSHCTATFNGEPSAVVNSQSLASDSREAFLASQGSAGNFPISAASSSASSPVFRHPIAFQTWSSPNVVLNICGDEAMISVCSPKKPGLFTAICYVLEKHKIQVVSAQMSSDYSRSLYMIQAQVAGASDQQAEVLPVEEIFKQAATEIMVWTSS